LTRLPNRREFHDRGRQAFAQAQRQKAPFTAVFIDLDRFKEVNDTLGHETGDRLLKVVADVIRDHVRASDVPGRLGGDEFALLLPNMKTDAVQAYVDKLRRNLLEAMHPRQADELMYEVKRSGRDRILLREY